MELDDDAADFHKETDMPNMWAIKDDEDEEADKDKEAKDHEDDEEEDEKPDLVLSGNLEEDLEKPSFLRRLGRRNRRTDSEHTVEDLDDKDKDDDDDEAETEAKSDKSDAKDKK
jgi:hypothetical protein